MAMNSLVSRLQWRAASLRFKLGFAVAVTGHEQGVRIPTDKVNVIGQRRWASFRPSYVHGGGTIPFSGHHLGHYVDLMEEKFGDVEAVVDCAQGIRKSFSQYKHDINNFATGLLSLNLNVGDRIAIWSPNRYEWMVTQFAAAKLGLILITLNPAYQTPELEFSLKKLEIRAIVMTESFKTQDYYKILSAAVPELENSKGLKVRSKKHPYFDTLIMMTDKKYPGALKFKDVSEAGGNDERRQMDELQSKIQSSHPYTVQFTSGTTGEPKGATICHHTLVNGSITISPRLGFSTGYHRFCCAVPLFHAFGFVGGAMVSMMNGNAIVLPSFSFNAAATLQSIQDEKCTIICGTPTMYLDMLRNPDFHKLDLSTITRGSIGGASVPPALMKKIIDAFKCPGVFNGYGSTETSASCFIQHYLDPIEEKLTTVGRIYDYMEAKLVDSEDKVVPLGSRGEICVRGYKVMLGYWGDQKKTKEAISADGWFHTGDVGILNENNTLMVVDRIKDMLIRGGENIYPTEIENLLITHPKIQQAHVLGIPDERLGEEVCAYINLKADQTLNEDEVREFCKGKIAHFKIPRYIRFVASFPMTPSGKVKKFILREEMKQILAEKTSQ